VTAHRHDVGIWASGITDAPYIASCVDCEWTSDAGTRDQAWEAGRRHIEDTAEEAS
jgi:hypothetical protein